MRAAVVGLAVIAFAGCARRPPPAVPVSAVHYQVGAPYELGGVWSYPRESFQAEQTGLATTLPDRSGLTADGEAFDQMTLAGSHRTLQLPAIMRVTNLENGRQLDIRLNDRGPARSGRIVGLTRRAAQLLGAVDGTQVRLQVQSAPSQALRDRLQGGSSGVTAAPVASVLAEALPPAGQRGATRPIVSRFLTEPAAVADTIDVPDRLPEQVTQISAQPGQLYVTAGRFSGRGAANTVKSRLSGLPVEIRHDGAVRGADFLVQAGPFADTAAADMALDQARAAGVTDAAIVVE